MWRPFAPRDDDMNEAERRGVSRRKGLSGADPSSRTRSLAGWAILLGVAALIVVGAALVNPVLGMAAVIVIVVLVLVGGRVLR